ncbi:lantibiotic dehydratase [Nonomuraea pusilla]|uniref:Lantibiotic dehydratase, C terminus n=1 Tax=Nonomuraea pusilla TaxID=46177 RepID=A0A1H8CAU7_9ACTN|nr:lantibiotic dehydratase [Nonomuraea pusilla]SEM92185.1 Lantibiotic dehydratase, C terminus [Nonomuraea pusilla]
MRDLDLRLSGDARVEALVMARMAGLPASFLTRSRSPELAARAARLVALERRLEDEGQALSAVLHALIGAAGQGLKPRLVGLRRAVHRKRRPGTGEWDGAVMASLPGDVRGRVTAWLADLDEVKRLRSSFPEVWENAMAEASDVLREAGEQAMFRRALSQAGPALYDVLTRWLDDDGEPPRRQSLVRLAKYVARAAAKTSPYSTFTVSGLASWDRTGPVLGMDGGREVRGVIEVSALVTHGLATALEQDPESRVRLNPSVTLTEQSLSFVGRPPREPVVRVPRTPAVEACLAALAHRPHATVAGLRDCLSGVPYASPEHEKFVKGLVEVGLLEPVKPVADLACDPLGEWESWLAAAGHESAPLVGAVRAETAKAIPVHDVRGHEDRQRRLRRAAGALLRRDDPGKHIFHENAVFAGPLGTCSLPAWRPVLEDLDVLRRWLAVFDGMLPFRIALGAYCAERFGPGAAVPLLDFHRAVQGELAADEGAERGDAAWDLRRLLRTATPELAVRAEGRLPRLRRLDQLREDARRLAASPADGTVSLDPRLLLAQAGRFPEWVEATGSLACYLQVLREEQPLRVALNGAYSGYGRGRSRMAYLLERAGGDVRFGRAAQAEGPLLAELGGLFGSPLNVRHASLPYEIDYPFTASTRPGNERMALNDLLVVHDGKTGLARLWSRERRAEVRTMHLGMMTEALLPPLARLLALGFGGGYYVHPSIPLLAVPPQDAPEEIVAAPRVEVGRVVLERARWSVPSPLVPRRAKGRPDADYLLLMLGWLARHGMPARCFVRIRRHGGPGTQWYFDRTRKPIYVDFANPLLVLVFERTTADADGTVVFEEALPEVEDAFAGDPADPHVSEFLLEVSGDAA